MGLEFWHEVLNNSDSLKGYKINTKFVSSKKLNITLQRDDGEEFLFNLILNKKVIKISNYRKQIASERIISMLWDNNYTNVTLEDIDVFISFINTYGYKWHEYCFVSCDKLDYFDDNKKIYMVSDNNELYNYATEVYYTGDNYVLDFIKSRPKIADLLLELAMIAGDSSRKNLIYTPQPSFEINLDNYKKRLNKELGIIDNYFNEFKINSEETINSILSCNSDYDIYLTIGVEKYVFVKFILKSTMGKYKYSDIITNNDFNMNELNNNTKDMDKLNNDLHRLSNMIQIEIEYPPEIEEKYKILKKNNGSHYKYHGSSLENWHSIIRNGIKIASNTDLMVNGAACGNGIYMASKIDTSFGYCGRMISSDQKMCMFGIFEVFNDDINNKNVCETFGNNIFVIKKAEMVLLRYLFYVPYCIGILKYYNTILDKKVCSTIHNDKKLKNKRLVKKSNKRLTKELQYLLKKDTKTEYGFDISLYTLDNITTNNSNLDNDTINDNIYKWMIKIYRVDKDSMLYKDMQKYNIEYIELECTFPENYPLYPPFIRVINPRFQPFTGHVTSGGSICLELLCVGTQNGWSSTMSMESVIISIMANLVDKNNTGYGNGEGRIQQDVRKRFQPYSVEEAKESFLRIARRYGWIK